MAPLAKYQKDSILAKVNDFLESKQLDNLTDQELEFVAKSLLVDQLKAELKTKIKKSKVDLDRLQDVWLQSFSSQPTKDAYGLSLKLFFDWMELNHKDHKDIFTLTSLDIDEYLVYLQKQYDNSNSIRERIAAASSFCAYLERHDIIPKNYFKGCKRPKKNFETKDAEDVPTEADMTIIENELWEEFHGTSGSGSAGKARQARLMLAVVGVIKVHGLRVGAFPSLVFEKDGWFKTTTKGKSHSAKIDPAVISLLEKLNFMDKKKPFRDAKVNSLQKSFERFCSRLVDTGKLTTVFSLHDLRHYAAVKHYQAHKDIIATQRFLGHSSVSITQTYLASLKCEV